MIGSCGFKNVGWSLNVLFGSNVFICLTPWQRMSTKSLNHVFIWIIFIHLGIMKDWTSVIVEVLFFCICVILGALKKMCRLPAKNSVVSSGLVGCFVLLASVSVCLCFKHIKKCFGVFMWMGTNVFLCLFSVKVSLHLSNRTPGCFSFTLCIRKWLFLY